MVLSKREEYIAIAALAVVGILLLDGIAITPFFERRDALQAKKQRLLNELEQAETLFARKRNAAPRWRGMLENGLKSDRAAAESRVLHAIRDWSQQAGFTVLSRRPERTTEKNGLHEIGFQVSGTGTMSSIAGFLWRIESSSLPVRLTDLKLGTRRPGVDDLTLEATFSALFVDDPQLQTSERTEGTE